MTSPDNIVLNLVFSLLDLEVFTGRFLTVTALTLAITIAIANVSFYLLERPVLRAKNIRFFARMEPADIEREPELTPEIAP